MVNMDTGETNTGGKAEYFNYNKADIIIQHHINEFVKKENEMIMGLLEKQEGFVSIEESKHLIEVNRMVKDGVQH